MEIRRLGFTYDLKDDYLAAGFTEEAAAEFDVIETIEGIEKALTRLGYEVDRIGNVRALLGRLQRGNTWDLVFNICEGVSGISREAQVPAILDVYQIPYVFSDAMVLALTLHKGMSKHVVRDVGIPTADFQVVEEPEDIENISLPFPLFVKPLAEGTGKGIGMDSKVHDMHGLREVCLRQMRSFQQAVIVETFLPGREITVGMLGQGRTAEVIGMMEVDYVDSEQAGIYSYESKAHYERFIRYLVPENDLFEQCAHVALRAWQALGCRDAGRIDLRLDVQGIPNFMEVNPLAGLNPIHSDLPILARLAGIGYQELIGMIMQRVTKRLSC